MITVSYPSWIGDPPNPIPPNVAEACPNEGNPNLRAEGSSAREALEKLVPKIEAEMIRIGRDDINWTKYLVAIERAQEMLASNYL